MNKKIASAFATVLFVVAQNSSAGSDWYFAVRTNLNSASIITGVGAAWYALCNVAAPVVKTGFDYGFDNIDQYQTGARLRKAVFVNGKKTLFFAGLALALEGVNKFYFKKKYHESLRKHS